MRCADFDAEPAEGEGDDPGSEDRFVVGPDLLRLAVMFDGIQQQAQDVDRRSVPQGVWVCCASKLQAIKNPASAGFFRSGAQERTRTSTVLPAST